MGDLTMEGTSKVILSVGLKHTAEDEEGRERMTQGRVHKDMNHALLFVYSCCFLNCKHWVMTREE